MTNKSLSALTVALALAACGSSASSDALADDTATAEATTATEPTAQSAQSSSQSFVDAAASSDMYEVEAAKLAERMGRSEGVKSFARMMIADHTASTEKLKAAADTAGLTLPAGMQPKHQTNLTALEAAGDRFDAVYAQQQVAAHEEALALLRNQAETGTIEPLKAFASETAPVVEGHLGHARNLR